MKELRSTSISSKKQIDAKFKTQIENILQPELKKYFSTNDAKKLLSGKESGHIMGTIIEEMCSDILEENGYAITKEVNSLGEVKKRAHSDFNIVESDDSVHRVNVKFSSEVSGQPNVCAANRLMDALRDNIIDGYYMLKVKYHRTTYETQVYFVDILDYIDCLTFNGGTGQIMLKEQYFYTVYSNLTVNETNLTLSEKKRLIYNLYITKMREHILLKQKQLLLREDEALLLN